MKLILYLFLPVLILLFSCSVKSKEDLLEKWKSEIVDTERAFAEMAQKEGIQKAFMNYAAEDVVVLRKNTILKGKEALGEYYKNSGTGTEEVSLTWKPDFVDVAASGDLGYTYGKFLYSITDSTGNIQKTEGIFHTVWKKQADGTWRFVWD
ncbi:MAG: hypothetical protein JXJ22_12985 [Bacteroidales bacterium]|nr:hypothetical protein [Bacteroidales bacterium]